MLEFQTASFAKRVGGVSYGQYKQSTGRFGKDRNDSYRDTYAKEQKERSERKLNFGIKNRWEQRDLDEVLKNRDVRKSQFRDIAKIKSDSYAANITTFHSVDEIYYFMDNLFTEGFSEEHIATALDVFLRDFGQF
jgi:hypothetical protein